MFSGEKFGCFVAIPRMAYGAVMHTKRKICFLNFRENKAILWDTWNKNMKQKIMLIVGKGSPFLL